MYSFVLICIVRCTVIHIKFPFHTYQENFINNSRTAHVLGGNRRLSLVGKDLKIDKTN